MIVKAVEERCIDVNAVVTLVVVTSSLVEQIFSIVYTAVLVTVKVDGIFTQP